MNQEIKNYRNRFNLLLESNLGDTKPLLSEDTGYTRRLDRAYSTPEGAREMNKNFQDPHLGLTILALASAFVPVVGPFISAGIQLFDASLYYKEGRDKEAGLVAFFALLPGIGAVVSKIPFVKNLTAKMASSIASKLTRGGKLTAEESKIVNAINAEEKFVEQAVNQRVKELSKDAVKKTMDPSKRTFLQKTANVGLKYGTPLAGYYVAGQGYNMAYDWLNPQNRFLDLNTLNKVKPTQADYNAASSVEWK